MFTGRAQRWVRKMSQYENQHSSRRLSTRSVVLLVLMVGLGAGVAAYSIGNALAATTGQSQQSSTNNPQLYGPRAWEGQRWNHTLNGSFTTFRGFSSASNVTITGFSIIDQSHVTVSLSFTGTGTAPAITVVGVAQGLSGSNTASAGWGTSTTVSVQMVGQGRLSSGTCLRVLVVPLTGP